MRVDEATWFGQLFVEEVFEEIPLTVNETRQDHVTSTTSLGLDSAKLPLLYNTLWMRRLTNLHL